VSCLNSNINILGVPLSNTSLPVKVSDFSIFSCAAYENIIENIISLSLFFGITHLLYLRKILECETTHKDSACRMASVQLLVNITLRVRRKSCCALITQLLPRVMWPAILCFICALFFCIKIIKCTKVSRSGCNSAHSNLRELLVFLQTRET
jgi:hypothetical protein